MTDAMYTTVVLYDKWFVKCIQYSNNNSNTSLGSVLKKLHSPSFVDTAI